MAKVDFSYLDRFAGEKAKVSLQVNPDYNRGQTIQEVLGRIMPGSKWASLSFLDGAHKPEHDLGKLVVNHIGEGVHSAQWSTIRHLLPRGIPYLGIETTFWKVERLEDGLVLFDHVPVSENQYNLLKYDGEILGQVNLPLPYRSPYDPLEVLGNHGKEQMQKFLAWREDLVQVK
jgi:hypothetical protein